jgi:hypothetical protein
MFDDVRDKTSAAKEWDRLINLPAEGPRSPESGPQPRTGDTTGAAISHRWEGDPVRRVARSYAESGTGLRRLYLAYGVANLGARLRFSGREQRFQFVLERLPIEFILEHVGEDAWLGSRCSHRGTMDAIRHGSCVLQIDILRSDLNVDQSRLDICVPHELHEGRQVADMIIGLRSGS